MDDIIKKLLLIPHISRFQLADIDEFLLNFKDRFHADSILYTLRSAMFDNGKLGFKYRSDTLLFTVSIRNKCIYIGRVYELKEHSNLEFEDFINRLKALDLNFIFKKLTLNQLNFIEKICGSKKLLYKLDLEDSSFSERNLRISNILNLTENRIIPKRFRLGISRFQNLKLEVNNIKISEISSYEKELDDLNLVLGNSDDKFYNVSLFLKYLYKCHNFSNKFIYRKYYINNILKGIYIIEKSNNTTASFHTGITTKDIGGLTEYLDYLIFKELGEEGFTDILLGGSESEGIYNYIRKLNPIPPSEPLYYYIYFSNSQTIL